MVMRTRTNPASKSNVLVPITRIAINKPTIPPIDILLGVAAGGGWKALKLPRCVPLTGKFLRKSQRRCVLTARQSANGMWANTLLRTEKAVCASMVVMILAVTVSSPRAQAASHLIDLRGYGQVRSAISPHCSEFVCRSARKADILLGELQADMFWDAGKAHLEKLVTIDGRKIPVQLFAPYGTMIAGRNGKKVIVVGGANMATTVALAAKNKLLLEPVTVFKPTHPYPKYLDSFSLGAVKCGGHGLAPVNRYRWKQPYRFVKRFIPGGMFPFMWPYGFEGTPAEDVDPTQATLDSCLHLAEKFKEPFSLSISTGFWPNWARNRWPEFIDQENPDFHAQNPKSIGWLPESFGMTASQRERTSLKYLANILLRYNHSPAMSLWELYCGDYICETYYSTLYQGHLGYSSVGLEGFRNWLKKIRHYSLAKLGQRWYGQKRHFTSWSQVIPPDPDVFFGDFNAQCLNLQTVGQWCWHAAQQEQTQMPAETSPKWVPVQMLPSNEMYALPPGPAFWRVKFNAAAWLNKNHSKNIYLICNVNNSGWAPRTQIWLNGQCLGRYACKVSPLYGPFGLKLTKLLQVGVNELVLQVNGPGNQDGITGPVFLTTTRPRTYPYLGRHGNARYVDALEWRLWELNWKVADTVKFVRSIDPNRPVQLCASDSEVKAAQGWDLSQYGGCMQDTGYESSYRPFNSRMGYAGGFYGSCEASNLPWTPNNIPPTRTTNLMLLNRMTNWAIFNGEGSVKEIGDPYVYMQLQNATGWFTKNKRKLQLIGKTLPAKPAIAILVSSRSALLGPDDLHSFDNWNIGRGELAASHYDNVFVTGAMLEHGMAAPYQVLFDSDTEVMGPAMIAHLRQYVEHGGTFIALQSTGRNSLLRPNSWPISQLTGFKVVATHKNGRITFGKNLPIFKGWEGKVFEGTGSALDWKDDQHAKGVNIGLAPASKGVVALARWSDGTIAVGMRKLGKGRVIILGSTFWRYGHDVGGTGVWSSAAVEPMFFHRLFTDLGVQRTADASTGKVFDRKMITKNGLQDWLVAMNQRGEARIADVAMALAKRPPSVINELTGAPVSFNYKNGWLWIKHQHFGPWGLKVFGVQRKDLAGGVAFWWFDKTKFWRRRVRVKPYVPIHYSNPADPRVIQLRHWRFLADKSDTVAGNNAWTKRSFNDGDWRHANNQPWNLQFADLRNYSGVGLYRSIPFNRPTSWKGQKILLEFYGSEICLGNSPAFYLNGKRLDHAWQVNVTRMLRPTNNVLAIEIHGRKTDGDYPLSGLMDTSIWLQPERQLHDVISLAGKWRAVEPGWASSRMVMLPGTVKGHHFVREVKIPTSWKGKNVFLYWKNAATAGTHRILGMDQNSLVMINGQFRGFPFLRANLPQYMTNITADVKYGQVNRIALWPGYWSANRATYPFQDYTFTLGAVGLGVTK